MSDHSNEQRLSALNVTEDGPVMRSVAIMSQQRLVPSNLFESPSTDLKKPFLHQNDSLLKTLVLPSAPSAVEAKAIPLPSKHPLDRSHLRIPGITSLEVSKRIAGYFFKESIAATYDNDEVRI
jgi:hypothetical protein